MGADFTQYLAQMEPGAKAASALSGVERVIYVLEGEIALLGPDKNEVVLRQGGYAYFPPDDETAPFKAVAAQSIECVRKALFSARRAGAARSPKRSGTRCLGRAVSWRPPMPD